MTIKELESEKIRLGIELKIIRYSFRLTREQVCKISFLNKKTITQIEKGRGCTLDSYLIYKFTLESLPKT